MKTTILTKMTKSAVICLAASLAMAYCTSATAQGSAFSYQGQLMDGTGPANGTYDFLFTVNDSPDPNSFFLAWIGRPGVLVNNGLFTVTLDFPGQQFNTGAPRWLEIHVQKTGSTNGLTTLLPRQQLLPTPYAITAANLAGVLPESQLSTNVARLNVNQVFTGTNSFIGGRVGIGTANPQSVLDVNGAVRSDSGGFIFPDGTAQTSAASAAQSYAAGAGLSLNSNVFSIAAAGVGNTMLSSAAVTGSKIAAGTIDTSKLTFTPLTSESDPKVGSLTVNYVPKWNGTMLANGTIFDNGNIGIGRTSPTTKLDVGGAIAINGTTVINSSGQWVGAGTPLTMTAVCGQKIGPNCNTICSVRVIAAAYASGFGDNCTATTSTGSSCSATYPNNGDSGYCCVCGQ